MLSSEMATDVKNSLPKCYTEGTCAYKSHSQLHVPWEAEAGISLCVRPTWYTFVSFRPVRDRETLSLNIKAVLRARNVAELVECLPQT